MGTRAWRLGSLLAAALAVVGCDASTSRPSPPRPSASASADQLAVHLAPRIGWDRALSKLDVSGDDVLIGLGSPPRPETDQRPAHQLWRWNARSDALVELHPAVRSAAASGAQVFAVDHASQLIRLESTGRRVLLSGASGKPAPLGDGSVVVARHEEPGETDLWLVPVAGAARAIAPAPGPDDHPIALGDGTIAFVSGRTTVASLFRAAIDGGKAEQLTNRGLVAGKPLTGFVPPPVNVIRASPNEIVYDAGGGEVWRVAIPSGVAGRIERGQP